jgi:hypothetical protein
MTRSAVTYAISVVHYCETVPSNCGLRKAKCLFLRLPEGGQIETLGEGVGRELSGLAALDDAGPHEPPHVTVANLSLLLPSQCSRHQVLAFWNMRSHGDAGSSRFQSHGIHGHCHLRKHRSG